MAHDKLSSYKTTITQDDGILCVTYQSTPIVTVSPTHIKLNTGGWFSVTTKRKMNQASHQFDLGYSVYQRDYKWYVDYKGKTYDFDNNTLILEV